MGEIKGFLKYKRQDIGHRPVEQRIHDFNELDLPLTPEQIVLQTARCMDCGIPFCHGVGCPLKNFIPDLNELVYHGHWQEACELLHSTNNFPEFTGRVCPAPCESACTLAISDQPVLIRHIELQIVERGFTEGWIRPQMADEKTGKRVAIIGSGPAGLAAAQQLARAGHDVVVFEKDRKIGGMLRYGIPDFKLGKSIIDRRLNQLAAEDVRFQTDILVGKDVSAHYLRKQFDCICLTMGAGQPRDLPVQGRGFENVIFAMDYLTAQNRINSGELIEERIVNAKDKNVVVLGGGDTGSDCVGTARRQGAKSIVQLEILPKPPEDRPPDTPWPNWPRIMRTSTSHEEGCRRMWGVMTRQLTGTETRVSKIHCCNVEWVQQNNNWKIKELPGTEFTLDADLVLLALGFLHVNHEGLVAEMGLELNPRGDLAVQNFQTTHDWVFAAGDTINGASLVVRAIDSGRAAGAAIDQWLRGNN
ncbi:MAG: glutamate synthase subunit beta [Sedimentisphaerales bacterium]|nr:glutamate synthase subunit beta [Sedimentisphaerales bacterium]